MLTIIAAYTHRARRHQPSTWARLGSRRRLTHISLATCCSYTFLSLYNKQHFGPGLSNNPARRIGLVGYCVLQQCLSQTANLPQKCFYSGLERTANSYPDHTIRDLLTPCRQNRRVLCFHLESGPECCSKCCRKNELRRGQRKCRFCFISCYCAKSGCLADSLSRGSQWKVKITGSIRYASMLVRISHATVLDGMLKLYRSLPLSIRSNPRIRLHCLCPQSH